MHTRQPNAFYHSCYTRHHSPSASFIHEATRLSKTLGANKGCDLLRGLIDDHTKAEGCVVATKSTTIVGYQTIFEYKALMRV